MHPVYIIVNRSVQICKLPFCKVEYMDINDRRRANLTQILRTMSAAELSIKSGVAKSSISSFLKKLPDGRFQRTIGEKSARKIETAIKKPEGWLDRASSVTLTREINEKSAPYNAHSHEPASLEDAFEVLRLALAEVDTLTRAQAKPIIDALFDNPQHGQHLGRRLAITLGTTDTMPHKRKKA
jgi:hypothetical protein